MTLQYDKLHCLSVSERVTFKLGLIVCMDKHLGTSSNTSPQPLKSHLDIDYVLPIDTCSLYHAADSTHMAVGLFQSLVQRSGTHYQMSSEMRRMILVVSNNFFQNSPF